MKKDILNEKYKIIKILGSGGTSTVYLCKDINTNIHYAVKIMKNAYDTSNLEQEWYILKCLNHKGIPEAKEFFIEDDHLHLVEEFIKGITLQQLIDNEGIPKLDLIYGVILQLCDIVSYLHSFDPPIIYRDMKPSNIMITKDDTIMLLDFGISRLYKEDKTTDTVFMGSKGYAAPEQYGLSQSQKETDIYGIGAVLFFLVTGNAPKNIMEPLAEESYKSNVPKNIIEIIKKSMQIDIKDRYSTVDELQKEIIFCLSQCSEENTDSTMLLKKDDATRIIGEHSNNSIETSRKRKGLRGKRVWLPIGIFLFTLFILFSIYTYFIKKHNNSGITEKDIISTPIPNPTASQLPQTTPKPTETPVPKEQALKKEEVVEGILIKSKPSKIAELDKEDTNDNSKGKKKKDEDKEKVAIYNLSTPAEVIKNEKFSIKLHSIAIRENYIVAYCNIENATSKTVTLSYNETYLYMYDGDKTAAIPSLCSDIGTIKSNTNVNNIVIYFKIIDIKIGKLILKTNIDFNDKSYNNETNLIINVK